MTDKELLLLFDDLCQAQKDYRLCNRLSRIMHQARIYKIRLSFTIDKIRANEIDLVKICAILNTGEIVPDDPVKKSFKRIGIIFTGIEYGWKPVEGGKK